MTYSDNNPYPENHQEIVNELLKRGRFVLYNQPIFSTIYDKQGYYREFFLVSFGYELIITGDFAYLTSKDSQDILSRNFLIFLSALCHELNQEGKPVIALIEKSTFDYDEVESYLKKSAFKETIESTITNSNNFKKTDLTTFLKSLRRKNIIEFTDSNYHKFRFTKAVKIFLDRAIQISNSKIIESPD